MKKAIGLVALCLLGLATACGSDPIDSESSSVKGAGKSDDKGKSGDKGKDDKGKDDKGKDEKGKDDKDHKGDKDKDHKGDKDKDHKGDKDKDHRDDKDREPPPECEGEEDCMEMEGEGEMGY